VLKHLCYRNWRNIFAVILAEPSKVKLVSGNSSEKGGDKLQEKRCCGDKKQKH